MPAPKITKHLSLKAWIKIATPAIVSRKLGINVATVRYWAQGHTYPRVKYMRRIKKMTKGVVGYEQIIDGTDAT